MWIYIVSLSLVCGMLGKFHQRGFSKKKPLLIPIVDFRLKPLVDGGIMVESEQQLHQWNNVCVCWATHTNLHVYTVSVRRHDSCRIMGLVQRVLGGWGVKDEVVKVLAREKDRQPGQHSGRRLGRRLLGPALQVTVSCVGVKRCSERMDCPSTRREEGKERELGRLWNRLRQEGRTEARFHRPGSRLRAALAQSQAAFVLSP